MNFVIVIVDTLRYDHIAAHGTDWLQTPNMDRLAAESWDFHNAWSASYPTIPHRTDALTGQYGAPFHKWAPLRHDRITLPNWLHEQAGYATQLIHDTPHLVNGGHNFDWPFNAWMQIRGAEVDRPWIDDSRDWPPNFARDPLFDFVEREAQTLKLFPTYVRANRLRESHADWNCARLFTTAASWLRDNASRDHFLLWVDCFDPHEPWDVPPEFATLYDDDPDWDGRIDPRAFLVRDTCGAPEEACSRVSALYSAKASWVDHWLGRLLEALDETGLADNTALLLTADHGTALNERGRFGKTAPVQEQEGHVPFLVRLPGGEGGDSDIVVQPQDIFATITDLAGIELPEGVESFNVVDDAQSGPGNREVAASATAATPHWPEQPILFSVFDGQWCLEYALRSEDTRLCRMGSVEDVADDHPDVVRCLRAAGLDEIERRGIDDDLLDWLRGEGSCDFPEDAIFWDGYPGPEGYTPYFNRLWTEW